MNRKLKFRCWNKKKKKWMFGYELPNLGGFSLFGEVTMMGGLNEVSINELDDIIVMQFTGLKDKNGKEIYEGDILYSESWNTNSKNINKYHIVEWGRCGWIARGYNGQIEVEPTLTVKSDFEIIGNIYENPELLNKTI